MSRHIQIRNVPDRVHRTLKARADQRGQSLSEYLLEEVQRIAALPTLEELRDRIAARGPVDLDLDPADVIRGARGRP